MRFQSGEDGMVEETLAEQGFRWPAEWEPHESTWLVWPHNRETWPGNFAAAVDEFAELTRAIASYEPVEMLVQDAETQDVAEACLGDCDDVRYHHITTNDSWIRDYGPTFLLGPNGQLGSVDWKFTAWGGKYPPWDRDARVARLLAAQIPCRRHASSLVLEGGAIDGNGAGCVLTTGSCLLNANRNPGCSRDEVDGQLQQALGANQIVWLEGVDLAGDDTDGHVDQLARFVDRRTVVTAVAVTRHDSQHEPLLRQRQQLRDFRPLDGAALQIIDLPLPSPKSFQGQPLPASYCNFYLVNGAVIVPQFDDPGDSRAVAILQSLFPDRNALGLPSRALVGGLGSFHCLTQQQPRKRAPS